jgi:hypothetical protein
VRQIFKLINVTLEKAGGKLSDMVQMTVFITDVRYGDRSRRGGSPPPNAGGSPSSSEAGGGEEDHKREEESENARVQAPAGRGRTAQSRRRAAAAEARERGRRETEAWAAASSAGDAVAFEAFLREWPHSQHADAARAWIKELERSPTRRWLLLALGGAAGPPGHVWWPAGSMGPIWPVKIGANAEPRAFKMPLNARRVGLTFV